MMKSYLKWMCVGAIAYLTVSLVMLMLSVLPWPNAIDYTLDATLGVVVVPAYFMTQWTIMPLAPFIGSYATYRGVVLGTTVMWTLMLGGIAGALCLRVKRAFKR